MKFTSQIAKTLALCAAFMLLLGALFLPYLCNTFLLPRLAQDLPFDTKEIRITTISPWRLTGSIRFMEKNQSVASIPQFEIRYSPATLLQAKFESIILEAPSLSLLQTDSGVWLKGMNPGATEKTEATTPNLVFELPIAIDEILIRGGQLQITTGATEYDFGVESQMQLGFSDGKDQKYELSTLSMDLITRGALRLKSHLKGVFSPKGLLIQTDVTLPSLKDVESIASLGAEGKIEGTMNVQAQLALTPALELGHMDASATMSHFSAGSDQMEITGGGEEDSFNLHISGDQNLFQYTIENIKLSQPETIECEITGTYSPIKGTFAADAKLFSQRLKHPFLAHISGTKQEDETGADILVTGKPFQFQGMTSGSFEASATISVRDNRIEGVTKGKLGSFQIKEKEIALNDISWKIPFNSPGEQGQKQKVGNLVIKEMNYKGEKLARLTAKLTPFDSGLNYSAHLVSTNNIKGDVSCKGSALFEGTATATCTLGDTVIESSALPGFITLPEDLDFTLTLGAVAELSYGSQGSSGKVEVSVKDGSLSSGESTIAGITTKVTLPSLPDLRSDTGQLMTVESIRSGKINLSNGKIFYTIENDDSLFLEKVRFNWCGGKIEAASLRLASDMKNVDTTFYCDRLSFAELLQQFGVEDTEGEGSLNGRLPLAIGPSGIHFDDGFLFSTPGNSGIIHFSNTSQLRQGIGAVGQTATLDYSIQALENFAYNWTKLSFNTEGENLLLAMQLDGKPASPLPFGYKNGQIVATEKGTGLQHPLRLDMNFRLPLQQLFIYGKNIQSLMENM